VRDTSEPNDPSTTSRRIEVDTNLQSVALPGPVINELCAHAIEARPEECCGLVTGGDDVRFRDVHRCRNEMTALHRTEPTLYPRDGREAYLMNELDYMQAQEHAEGKGDAVTAVYHSHVGAGVYFSEMDQEFADASFFPFPAAAQVVLAVWEGRIAGAGMFTRDAQTGLFVGVGVELRDA
jgi:proteasome lid subunit RPN8/RPN11